MIFRRFVVPVLAATLVVGACKGDPPPPPAPPGQNMDSLAAYNDSVARADSLRRAAEADAVRRAAEAEAEAAAERDRAAARATLEELVFFDYDMAEIRPEGVALLRRKADILRASPTVQLRIEGHADERGSTEYNFALGNRRASAIRQVLVGYGLAESRFAITSLGEDRPLAMGRDEASWARNRRGEFAITAGANAINSARD